MRILRYGGRLVEEVGHVTGEKVVFLKYLKEEDKPECECGRSIDKEISIVEGCKNWDDEVEKVETLV